MFGKNCLEDLTKILKDCYSFKCNDFCYLKIVKKLFML